MKLVSRLLTLILLTSFCAKAQLVSGRRDDIVLANVGNGVQVVAGASILVCINGATGTPCSPTASIYSDSLLTIPLSNPTNADANGNYFMYAAPGKYQIQISGVGLTTRVFKDVVVPNDPVNPVFNNITINGTCVGCGGASLTASVPLQISASNISILGCTNIACAFNGLAPLISTPVAGAIMFNSGSSINWAALSGNILNPGAVLYETPSGVPSFSASPSLGSVTVSNQFISTLATGTPPLVVTSTTNVPHLNASLLNGNTFASPGPIGGTTPGTGNFTTLTVTSCTGCITSFPYKLEFPSGSGFTPVSINNSNVETTLGTFTLSANEMSGAQFLDIYAEGNLVDGSGGVNDTIKLYLDGNVVLSTAMASPGVGNTIFWEITAKYTLTTGGAGGTIECQGKQITSGITSGFLNAGNVQSSSMSTNTATFSFDTTATHVIKLTTTMSNANAANVSTQRQFTIERKG